MADSAISDAVPDSGAVRQYSCRTVVAHSAADAAVHGRAWQLLAEKATEPNVFYEPWNLLPALQTVVKSKDVALLFVYTRDRGEERLIGFFPFERLGTYKGLPGRRLRLVQHLYCFLCTPLVHVEYADRCLRELAQWLARYSRHSIVELQQVSASFREMIEPKLQEQSMRVTVSGCHERALYRPGTDADSYLSKAMPKKTRKEFRRLGRRLAEHGDVQYRHISSAEDAEPWIQSFLDLEKRGWKGRARTAIACSDGDRDYFESAVREAHRLGRLRMIGLFCDDEPIALSCKFLAGDGSFAFKIAFDEKYQRYSPGMLLEMNYVVQSHDEDAARWMDSCADPDHFMANRLWLDRRTVETVVASSSHYGRLVVAAVAIIRRLVVRVRGKPQTAGIAGLQEERP